MSNTAYPDLDLDGPERDELVIDGDLIVDGSILNADADDGRALHVNGNLRARNLIAGGARVTIDGDAHVDGLLYCHGSECIDIGGETRAGLEVHEHAVRAGLPLSEYLHRDVMVLRVDDEYPIPVEEIDARELVERIRAGLPVLRDADDPRPRKTYAEWLADCARYGLALEWVPPELITDELVDTALANDPYAIQCVPVEFRTAERCRIGVAHRGFLLAEVPPALRTAELCALAIEHEWRDIDKIIELTPEEHLTPELCLRAAQRDGFSVKAMPERFRTFELWVAAVTNNPFVLREVPPALREQVAQAVRGPRVELTPEERAVVERPPKMRLFLYFLKHLFRRQPAAPRRD